MQGSQVPVCRRALLSLLFGESDSIRAIAWQRTDLLAEGYQKEDPRCSKLYVTVFKKQGTKSARRLPLSLVERNYLSWFVVSGFCQGISFRQEVHIPVLS